MAMRSEERLVRRPMSFEDYLALPEGLRAEYVDGQAIVSPTPAAPHQRISFRLAAALDAGLPGTFVVEAVGVWTAERRSRIPDITVTEEPFEGSWAESTPILVVEILSPSTRSEDTLRKSGEYFTAGIGQYWVVDRDNRSLTVLVRESEGWRILLELDDQQPTGIVAVGEYGEVALDLERLLAT